MTHYQNLLLNPPCILFLFFLNVALNLASLLPDLDASLYDCAGIMSQVCGLRNDLQDQPLSNAELTWYMDGSTFTCDGKMCAGVTMVTYEDTIWAIALPFGTSQKDELTASTKAL